MIASRVVLRGAEHWDVSGRLSKWAWGYETSSNGGIDYLPHVDKNEEALEIFFDVHLEKNPGSANFDISLIWSDGVLIEEFTAPYEISFANDDDLINEIAMKIRSEKDRILLRMKEEMLIDRPPYYSKV